jgi:hypothetical protein
MSNCPFCGVMTPAPHESQEGCIEALNAEIARMRTLLSQVQSAAVPGPFEIEDNLDGDPGSDPSR